MRALLIVTVLCLLALFGVRGETYPEEYDSLDVDALLSNEDKVKSFVACLQDDASCTERGSKLKAILLDALKTNCSRCTERQKSHIRKAVKFFIANQPALWQKVVKIHDPGEKYAEQFQKFLQEA